MTIKIFIFTTALSCFTASASAQNRIAVSKQKRELYVLNSKNDTLCIMQCGIGLNKGNKTRSGDKRTPEGTFTISKIQDSKLWTHDFKDGYGPRKGAYGPWFIRLHVPRFSGIGIHGTCFPNSIGTRCSDGCIRLRNEDVSRLLHYIKAGDKVTIAADE
ncbi:MAG: L,D-transpeptidase [Bacteroidaceae bacterium]